MNRRNAFPLLAALSSSLTAAGTPADTWAGPPGTTQFGDQKVLTLISRDPTWVRGNNNMQVAAELANAFWRPIQSPHALTGPGVKAPAVYWGDELIAEDGARATARSVLHGELADIREIEGVPKHPTTGCAMASEVKPKHEALKAAIQDVK